MFTLTIRMTEDHHAESPWEFSDFEFQEASRSNASSLIRLTEEIDDCEDHELDYAWLSVYRHSNEHWSLLGTGTQCRWDNTKYGALVTWDVKSWAGLDPLESLKGLVERYNDYCNGNCWVLTGSLFYAGPKCSHCTNSGPAVTDDDLTSWDFTGLDDSELEDTIRNYLQESRYEIERFCLSNDLDPEQMELAVDLGSFSSCFSISTDQILQPKKVTNA